MRLTTRTSLALRTLMYCAANDGRIVQRHEISTSCDASENHLAQVIHLLARLGYLKTRRGRHGGLSLNRPASEISVGQVFRSFEAPLPFADCWPGSERTCPLKGFCRLTCVLQEAMAAFYARIDRSTIADLVQDNTALTLALAAPADQDGPVAMPFRIGQSGRASPAQAVTSSDSVARIA